MIRYSIRRLCSGWLSLGMLMLFVLTSCMKDPFDQNTRAKDGEAFVTFSLALPESSAPSTRALSGNDEKAVENIQILAFQNGTYIYRAYNNSINNNKFTVSLRTGDFDLVILANSLDIVDAFPLVSGTTTQSEVLDGLVRSITEGTGWDTSDDVYKTIPMSSGILSKTISETTDMTSVPVSLYRMLSKINVEVMLAAQTDFELKSVRLYNYNTNGRIYPRVNGGSVNTGLTNIPDDPGNVIGDTDSDALRYMEITGGISCKETIYAFEAANGGSTTFSTNPCLVVGGSYEGGATTYYRVDFSDKDGKYWDLLRNHRYEVRITAVKSPGYPDENTAFESRPVDIETDIAVWDEKPVPAVYDPHTLTIGENNIILTKEKTRSGIVITSTYEWSAEVAYSGTDTGWLTIFPGTSPAGTSIMLYTADENTGTASRKATITVTSGLITKPITITQTAYEHPAASDYYYSYSNCYMVQPGSYAVKIPVDQANNGIWESIRYDDEWEPIGNDLEELIDEDDVLEGDLLWTDCAGGLSINSVVHRILRSGTGYGGFLIVIPGTSEGNSVVTLKINTEEKIKWSWHIWNTSYNPSTYTYWFSPDGYENIPSGKVFRYDRYYFMDRNIGATTATPQRSGGDFKVRGMLYQWGRKDPFPGAWEGAGSATEPVLYNAAGVGSRTMVGKVNAASVIGPNGDNFLYSVNNPLNYIYNSAAPNDWYAVTRDNQKDDLWKEYPSKSAFDPCPVGWQLPSITHWDGLVNSDGDYAFPLSSTYYGRFGTGATPCDVTPGASATIGFWPLTGGRGQSSGTLSQNGAGNYWSGTYDENATGFSSSQDVSSSLQNVLRGRANGYAVRCVQDPGAC